MLDAAAFSDHFSGVADGYSAYRPGYPDSLFAALAAVIGNESRSTTVWDCAAGNGQASVALSKHFGCVLATDASVKQIAAAPPMDNLFRAAATAERCPLRDRSVGLVTVAQALHWFRFEQFFAEVKRVLAPGGVLAVWSYGLLRVDSNKDVERAVDHFSEVTLGRWWPRERQYVNDSYATIPFPFERIELPAQHMSATWTRQQLIGYLRTWSSVSKKQAAEGIDPVIAFESILAEAWGSTPTITLRWPLTVLVGRTQ